MNPHLQKTLESAFRECETHRQKIQRVQALLQPLFPLQVTTFEQLSEEEVEHLDQLIYRFTKMQDTMGKRLFPSIYGLLEEDSDPKAFLDILHRLEKLGVLSSVVEWQFFRNLRNNLAHDYPEGVAQTVDTLNLLMERIETFIRLFETAQEDWQRRERTPS